MDASEFSDHISRRFNKDIEDLRNSVLAMGGLVESQLSQAIAAIVAVLSAGVLAGVIIGVVLSLGWLVYISATPEAPVLGREPCLLWPGDAGAPTTASRSRRRARRGPDRC